MTAPRQELIDSLVGDLRPVRRPGRVSRDALLWLLAGTVWAVSITLVTGPWRPGALRDLSTNALFVMETGLAALAIVALAFTALRSAIPGEWVTRVRWLWLLPFAGWVAYYVVGLWHPPAYVAPFGGRYQCPLQVVLFSLPAFALLVWVARRQFPLQPRATGFFCGVAAAAIPAAIMQFACVYTPAHVLTHHMAPIAVTSILGALLGPVLLTIRTSVPRPRNSSVH